MNADAIASAAWLIGDPARAQILVALFDVDGLPASALARCANISPQTASAHLGKLCAGGLLEVEKHGRHRYYRLTGAEVAQAVEALMVLAPRADAPRENALTLEPLGFARTCYDHLAGKLGVAVTDACLGRDWLRAAGKDFELTPEGERGFRTFDIDTGALKMQRRGFARQCLDWTERRYHLAGALGAALTQSFFERRWLLQNEGSRVVHLTNEGRKGLSSSLAVRP